MSEDKVVSILKAQHKTLDESVHSLAKETANIKDIAIKNQEGIEALRDDTTILKAQMVVVRHDIASLNTRFDQLELLIRQALPKN